MSVYTILLGLADVFGPLTLLLITWVGWRWAVRCCGVFGLLFAIIGIVFIREPKRPPNFNEEEIMELSSKVAVDVSENMNSRNIDAMGDLSRSVSVTEKLLIERQEETEKNNFDRAQLELCSALQPWNWVLTFLTYQ